MTMTIYDCGPFTVPPECGGQIVELSYAYSPSAGIVERSFDRSDQTEQYRLYDDPSPEEGWDPWNGTPRLGRCLGTVTVDDDD